MTSVSFPTVTRIPAVLNKKPNLFQIQALKMSGHAPGKRPICPSCSKPARLCLCSRIKHRSINNAIAVTILQHSHEKNHPLNSTRIVSLGLKNVSVVPVSDVHFEARFDIQLMASENGGISTSVGSNGGFECSGDRLGKPNFSRTADAVEGEIELEESGTGIAVAAAKSDNRSDRDWLQEPTLDRILDSVETQEAVRELGSKTAFFASKLESGSCQKTQNEPEEMVIRRISDSEETQKGTADWDSKTANFATEVENVSNCRTNLQISESHEPKLDSGIQVSWTEKENTHLESNHKQLEESDFKQIPECSAETKTLLISDFKTNGVAASSKNGFLKCSTCLHNTQSCSSELVFEQAPASETGTEDASFVATSKIHQNNEKLPEFDMMSCATTAKQPSLDTQNHQRNPCSDLTKAHLTSKGTTITATIAKCGFTCSVTSLRASRNGLEESDIGLLSSSSIGKVAISNGFIVRRVQRKPAENGGPAVGDFEEFEVTVPPGSALLFPSKKSINLESVDFKVKHLIVLDGTWSKAKRMYHENPWLKLLPHLKLDSMKTSLYSEVRQQPMAGCLSTIESIVCALKSLGEDNAPLDDLLDVFESMVADQRRCKDERLSRESPVA